MTKLSLSSVFCLLSAPLAPLASRLATLWRGGHAGRVTLPAPLAALALLLPFAAAATTDALTYTGTLGKYDASGAVVSAALTTNVEMTVALYDKESGGQTLWCRRLTVPVWKGLFAVGLEDGCGTSDLELNPKYMHLSDALTNGVISAAWWVGISKLRVDGQSSPEVTIDTPARGKLAAVPFALEAGRTDGARADFTVRGDVTARTLSLDGTLTASNALFGADATFGQTVTFGEGGLIVTGLFTRPNLDYVKIVRAARLNVTKSFTAGNLCVTDGSATTLTPDPGGLVYLGPVTVLGALEGADSVAAGVIAADKVAIVGKVTLGSGGAISWHAVDGTPVSLAAPNGVYPAETSPTTVAKAVGDSVGNTSGTDVLATHATASSGSSTTVTVKHDGNSVDWCYAGGAAEIGVTTICPLAPNDTAATAGSGHVLTRTFKELSK